MKIRIDTPKINLKPGIQKVSPALEDLEVNPSSIEQVFNHPNSYGYDTVTVKAVEADELNITPTTQNQEYVGLYGTVNVDKVDNSIDNNIKAENIKNGINILGVEGIVEALIGEEREVMPTEQTQVITPSEGKTGITKITVKAIPEEIKYDVMNKYITNTLEKLRIDNIPTGNLRFLQPGGYVNASRLSFVKYLEFPNNTDTLGTWQFGNLTGLLRFDAGYTTKFDNVCLYGCSNLKALIIRTNDVVPSLYSRSAIALASNGKIYVPKNMIEDYKVATNWTNFADNFKELYIADTIEEKEQTLIDSEIESGSMIVCDIDESYTIKE